MMIDVAKRKPLFILLTAHLLTIVDIFIVNIALPSIQLGIKASHGSMQLIVAMYMVGFASFLILGGKAGDYFGRKRVFMIGVLLFMISSAGCGFAVSSPLLITMRFVQGISAGLMSPQILSYIQLLFKDHQQRTYALGWYGIFIGVGTVMGQFFGGFLIEMKPWMIDQSWRYIFLINLPICLVVLALSQIYLMESKYEYSVCIDYRGGFILCLGLLVLVLSLTFGFEYKYLGIIGLLISSLLLTGFVIHQKRMSQRIEDALLNISLFTYKNFNIAVLAASMFMLMLDAYFFVLAIFLQQGMGLLPFQAGYFVVFQGCGFILSSLFSARLVLRYGKRLLMAGIGIIMFALIWQMILFSFKEVGFLSFIVMLLHGTGVALVLPSFANIALKGLPEKLIGNASGVYSTMQQLFGALGIAFTGGIFLWFGEKGDHFENMLIAFKYATIIHFLCLLGVLLILICLPESILPRHQKTGK